MERKLSNKAKAYAAITTTILILLGFVYLSYEIMSVEQCPLEYTQEQIDSSDCNIGANLGGVIILFVFMPIGFSASWFAYHYGRKNLGIIDDKAKHTGIFDPHDKK